MSRHMMKALLIVVATISIIAPSSASFGQTFVRMEIRPIQSVTLTGEQFLLGEKSGKVVMLAGELRIPKPGTDRLPAVILVHGSGGISASPDRWAQELNSIGVANFHTGQLFGPRNRQHAERPISAKFVGHDAGRVRRTGEPGRPLTDRPQPHRRHGLLQGRRGSGVL
jgi:hypothetical protein